MTLFSSKWPSIGKNNIALEKLFTGLQLSANFDLTPIFCNLKTDYLLKSAFPLKMNAAIEFLVVDLLYTDFLKRIKFVACMMSIKKALSYGTAWELI